MIVSSGLPGVRLQVGGDGGIQLGKGHHQKVTVKERGEKWPTEEEGEEPAVGEGGDESEDTRNGSEN